MIFDTYSYRKKLFCAETPVVKYDLCYPFVRKSRHADMLNTYNRRFIDKIVADSSPKLYKDAVKQHKTLVMYNSFTSFDVKNNFNVMFSNEKILSIFWDFYVEMGASGFIMHRVAHNWALDRGKMIPLQSIFCRNCDWRSSLVSNLRREVSSFEKEMGISCFARWEEVLARSLDESKYYISDNGLVIYCPQGSIASDLWGIPSFLVPFSEVESILDKKFAESLQ